MAAIKDANRAKIGKIAYRGEFFAGLIKAGRQYDNT